MQLQWICTAIMFYVFIHEHFVFNIILWGFSCDDVIHFSFFFLGFVLLLKYFRFVKTESVVQAVFNESINEISLDGKYLSDLNEFSITSIGIEVQKIRIFLKLQKNLWNQILFVINSIYDSLRNFEAFPLSFVF